MGLLSMRGRQGLKVEGEGGEVEVEVESKVRAGVESVTEVEGAGVNIRRTLFRNTAGT